MNQDIRPRDATGTLLFKADTAYVVTAGLTAGGGFFSSAPFDRANGEVHWGERLTMYRTQLQNEQGRELVKLWMLFEKLLKLL
jgi:hypothetical protein